MDIHIVFLSGMNEEDTSVFFQKHNWDLLSSKDQIVKKTQLVNINKKPIRVTLWSLLNTPLIHDLIMTIQTHMKYIVLLYHAHKPITLMRCIGIYNSILKNKNYTVCILATHTSKPFTLHDSSINKRLIGNLTDIDDKELPHYNTNLKKIIKLIYSIIY